MSIRLLVLFFLVVNVLGCANKRSIPELPRNLNENQGLLVARFYIVGMKAMENASINIDGAVSNSALKDGYLAIPLAAGEHHIREIRAQGQLLSQVETSDDVRKTLVRGGAAPTYIYVPGYSYVVHYTTLSVDRKFKIEPGKITNLGLIIYLPKPEDSGASATSSGKSRQFFVMNVDNGKEINSFLESNYPDFVKTLSSRDIKLADSKFVDADKMPLLRRLIALHESSGVNMISSGDAKMIYGRVGTIFSAKSKNAFGGNGEVIDTGTVADIVGGVAYEDKFTFLTSDAKLLTVQNNSVVSTTNFPYRVQPIVFKALGKNDAMAIDNQMRIYSSAFPYQNWRVFDAYKTSYARNDVSVASDSDGVYVALGSIGFPEAIYYVAAGQAEPKVLASPTNEEKRLATGPGYLMSRPSGLFVLFGDNSSFYFLSKEKQKWNMFEKPKKKCKPINFDQFGINLMIECEGEQYKSQNSGATWTKISNESTS